MDDDKNRKLNMEEFRKGVEEYGLNFPKSEIDTMFRLIDADQNGSIDYEEFLRKLRVYVFNFIIILTNRILF
jgi:Ca2+-binding EF-hand superfamily protein